VVVADTGARRDPSSARSRSRMCPEPVRAAPVDAAYGPCPSLAHLVSTPIASNSMSRMHALPRPAASPPAARCSMMGPELDPLEAAAAPVGSASRPHVELAYLGSPSSRSLLRDQRDWPRSPAPAPCNDPWFNCTRLRRRHVPEHRHLGHQRRDDAASSSSRLSFRHARHRRSPLHPSRARRGRAAAAGSFSAVFGPVLSFCMQRQQPIGVERALPTRSALRITPSADSPRQPASTS
jgi:hypothetical protein